MNAKAETLLRQQYLVPRRSVKKLQEMSRKEGVSTGELARRAIEAYTSGRVLTESEEETAARALLAEVHNTLRDVLKRIDASLAEVHDRERAFDHREFRAQVRDETMTWLRRHPQEAEAITKLFMPQVPT
jgi:DNA primase catalytic subunit